MTKSSVAALDYLGWGHWCAVISTCINVTEYRVSYFKLTCNAHTITHY